MGGFSRGTRSFSVEPFPPAIVYESQVSPNIHGPDAPGEKALVGAPGPSFCAAGRRAIAAGRHQPSSAQT